MKAKIDSKIYCTLWLFFHFNYTECAKRVLLCFYVQLQCNHSNLVLGVLFCFLNFFLTGESFLFSASLGIEDTFINRFKSFNELKRYAKLTSDHELLSKIKVCATA